MTYTTRVSHRLRIDKDNSNTGDVEHTFICGVFSLGILSIGAGFVKDKIALIVIRALSGIGAQVWA